jgi:hypothetical protein
MTGRQKRYWQILATFLLGGAVAGVAYNVVRGHLAPINFATGAIFGLMIASGIGAFEALVSQGPARLWLRSLPLAGAVAGSVATILAHDARGAVGESARLTAHAALSNKSAMTTAWPRIS